MQTEFPMKRTFWMMNFLLSLGLLAFAAQAEEEEGISFNRDIRPILSDNCFACHGPDAHSRKAKLRLDERASATAKRDHGTPIDPGRPETSLLIQRVTASDPQDRMPPEETGKRLDEHQIELLKQWIAEGAEYQGHWAFFPPERPDLPAVDENLATPIKNPIDNFIFARLQKEGLAPSPAADKETLIRRVTFDLTGLPPSLPEIDAFLNDTEPGAYERLVERLLKSPHYGEQMGRYWLDAARYGDTHGLHLDNERSIWPYRDWVIEAMNNNLPFDEFTRWQLAGDLLEDPTLDQLTATGFIRCNVTTSEGGAIPEEFYVRYTVDRVETVSTVFMGLTAGCAVCHDHKFDPLTQKEFYQLFAYFNNLDENPMDGNALLPPPVAKLATEKQIAKLAEYDQEVNAVEETIRKRLAEVEYHENLSEEDLKERKPQDHIWIDDELPEGAKPSGDDSRWEWGTAPQFPVFSGEKSTRRTGEGTTQHYFSDSTRPLTVGEGDQLFAHVYLDPENPPKTVMLQFNDGSWDHRAFWGEDSIDFGSGDSPGHRRTGDLPATGEWVRLEVDASHVGLKAGAVIKGWAFTQNGGTAYWDAAGIKTATPQDGQGWNSLLAWEITMEQAKDPQLPDPVKKAIQTPRKERTEEQRQTIRHHFFEHAYGQTREVFEPLHEKLTHMKKEREEFDQGIPRTMVAKERQEKKPAFLLNRGEYDNKGEEVQRAVPDFLPGFPENAPMDRLGFAEWLLDPRHPLTARVTVNRFWQHHFGTGIVKTSEDFGSQGDPPSHPRLLDWLATEFVRSGWDMKHIHRLIVTSATYRQQSSATPELQRADPSNRLLGRGPRYRFDAETLRDNALALSGLLVDRMGGRGVRPYQPEGLWEAVAYPTSTTAKYQMDQGRALYRRSIYTFWKRTSPPPAMTTFDAPSRESCTVRRERTNTPLQALVLMNDPQFVEAARHLGMRIYKEGGESITDRLRYGFRLVTARYPKPKELDALFRAYFQFEERYANDPEAAKELLTVGRTPLDDSVPREKQAAWTMLANTLLNLNETITKR